MKMRIILHTNKRKTGMCCIVAASVWRSNPAAEPRKFPAQESRFSVRKAPSVRFSLKNKKQYKVSYTAE